jgi:peptidyl-prolyl cis-trans isomerase SurA
MVNLKNILTITILLSVILFTGCSSSQDQVPNNDVNSQVDNSDLENNPFMDDSNTQNSEDEVLAIVNGEEVTSSEVEEVEELFLQQGQQVSQEEALNQVVSEVVLSQKVEEEGVSVTTTQAETIIENQLASQNATLEQYKNQLQMQGISYEKQLDSVKSQVATQKYLESKLDGKGINVSEEEAKEFYETYKQQSQEELPAYEELKPQIVASLEQQKEQQMQNAIIEELKADANIKYMDN